MKTETIKKLMKLFNIEPSEAEKLMPHIDEYVKVVCVSKTNDYILLNDISWLLTSNYVLLAGSIDEIIDWRVNNEQSK